MAKTARGPLDDSATPSDNKKAIFQKFSRKNKWLRLQISDAVTESQSLTECAIASQGRHRPANRATWEGVSQRLGVRDLSWLALSLPCKTMARSWFMPERQGVFRILSLLLVLEGDLKTIVVYKALPGREHRRYMQISRGLGTWFSASLETCGRNKEPEPREGVSQKEVGKKTRVFSSFCGHRTLKI